MTDETQVRRISMPLLFLFLMSAFTHAAECEHFEMRGEIRLNKITPQIIIAKESKSEKALTLADKDRLKVIPYVKKDVVIEVIKIKNDYRVKGKPELVVPDPLRTVENSYVKEKGPGSCVL